MQFLFVLKIFGKKVMQIRKKKCVCKYGNRNLKKIHMKNTKNEENKDSKKKNKRKDSNKHIFMFEFFFVIKKRDKISDCSKFLISSTLFFLIQILFTIEIIDEIKIFGIIHLISILFNLDLYSLGQRLGPRLALVPVLRVAAGKRVRARSMASAWARAGASTGDGAERRPGNKAWSQC